MLSSETHIPSCEGKYSDVRSGFDYLQMKDEKKKKTETVSQMSEETYFCDWKNGSMLVA